MLTIRWRKLAVQAVALLIAAAGLLAAEPASAATPRFFEGTLSGGDIEEWTLWIGINGKSVYGTTFGEGGPAGEDRLIGARLEGTLRGSRVKMRVFGFTATDSRLRIGTLTGTLSRSRNRITGSFSIAGRRGAFSTSLAARNTSASSRLVGDYSLGEALQLRISLRRDKTFRLSVRTDDGLELGTGSGVWYADREDRFWLLPLRMVSNNPLFTLSLKAQLPVRSEYELIAGALDIYDPFDPERVLFSLVEEP